MIIKYKRISRRTAGGAGGAAREPLTLKIGENEYKEENAIIETPQTVNRVTTNGVVSYPDNSGNVVLPNLAGSVAVGTNTYAADETGKVTIPQTVNAITVGDETITPDSAGVVVLPDSPSPSQPNDGRTTLTLNSENVGSFSANQAENNTININSAVSIKQNEFTTQVDESGNIDLGAVTKSISYYGVNYTPGVTGNISLPNMRQVYIGGITAGLLNNTSISYPNSEITDCVIYPFHTIQVKNPRTICYNIEVHGYGVLSCEISVTSCEFGDNYCNMQLLTRVSADNTFTVYPTIIGRTFTSATSSFFLGVVIRKFPLGHTSGNNISFGYSMLTSTSDRNYIACYASLSNVGNKIANFSGINIANSSATYSVDLNITDGAYTKYSTIRKDWGTVDLEQDGQTIHPNARGTYRLHSYLKIGLYKGYKPLLFNYPNNAGWVGVYLHRGTYPSFGVVLECTQSNGDNFILVISGIKRTETHTNTLTRSEGELSVKVEIVGYTAKIPRLLITFYNAAWALFVDASEFDVSGMLCNEQQDLGNYGGDIYIDKTQTYTNKYDAIISYLFTNNLGTISGVYSERQYIISSIIDVGEEGEVDVRVSPIS